MENTVAIQKCDEYDFNKVYETIKKMMEQVPPPDVTNKTVLLKPNILSPKKVEAAVCTHPIIVGACVKIFLERGAKRVIVGESPATATSSTAAKLTGIYDQVINAGGEWIDFIGEQTIPCPNGRLVKNVEVTDVFSQADIIVSLAKLKTHQLMSYTGAMKNLFGLVVGLKKAKTHYRFSNKYDFAKFITDLNISTNPTYSIIDAIVAMEGDGGPGNGDPIQLGFLASSQNILALDWICSSIVGYNPHLIPNLEDALSRQIWLSSPNDIEIIGEHPQNLKPESFKIVQNTSDTLHFQEMLPKWLNNFITLIFTKTPRFDKKKCIQCARCIQICPAKILSFNKKNNDTTQDKQNSNKKTRVIMASKTKCLHCFCCHEICPVEAITLHRF